ncbi:MAG: hypothetical protein AAGH60_15585 [Pseudomonadota bacterium]
MSTKIDTKEFGLATHFDSPKSKENRHRSKWRIRFDTGVEMLVPGALMAVMQFHLQEADPRPPEKQ